MELTQILLSPVVTEKSNAKQSKHVYTFLVHPQANKLDVAEAVKKAYGVRVNKVAMLTVRPKTRLTGRRVVTKRPAAKKALVTIDPKQTIDINKFSKK